MKNYFTNLSRSFAIVIALVFSINFLTAQVAINTDGSAPNSSAMLDVKSSDKGLLIPRLTTTQRNALSLTAVAGLMVYDTNLNRFFFFNGTTWDSGSVGNLWTRSGTFTNLTNTTDFVGIGTNTPIRQLEVDGGSSWQVARLSSTAAGAVLEFKSSYATNWALGSYGNALRFISTTDDFSSVNDEYYFTDSEFRPWDNDTKTFGSTSVRWSNLYSVAGNFSGAVATGALTTTGNATISGIVGIGTTAPGAELEVKNPSGETEIRITRPSSSYAGKLSFFTGATSEWNIITASGNTNMLIYRGAGNTTGNLGLMHTGGKVGIGTLAPTRTLDVSGPWQTARISSTSSGATLEFVSSTANDWAVTTWAGNMYFLSSTDDFTSKTDEYNISTTSFNPVANNAKTLGTSSTRWSNTYSVLGNYSGAVSTGALTTTGNATFTGDIGIGTTLPAYEVDINRTTGAAWFRAKSGDGYAGMIVDKGASTSNGYLIYKTAGADKWYVGLISNDNFAISTSFGSPDGKFYINSTGQVGIGTTSMATGYKLSVAGKVICEELRVNLASGWPDYVFGQDYQLMSLSELENYIQINGHLPNIPEAGEMQESGLEVGEMQRLMMEKIEELSLYIIQQQKEIEELKSLISKNQN